MCFGQWGKERANGNNKYLRGFRACLKVARAPRSPRPRAPIEAHAAHASRWSTARSTTIGTCYFGMLSAADSSNHQPAAAGGQWQLRRLLQDHIVAHAQAQAQSVRLAPELRYS